MSRLDVVWLTPEGRQQLERELAELEGRRPAVSQQLSEARAGGNDPSENLDLRDAMDELQRLEGRIGELKAVLAAAEPLENGVPDGTVRLGSRVTIRHADGEEAVYTLVSPAEADPRRGRISVESPIGRALVGRHTGDEATADTPAGTETLAVLDVS